MLTDRHRIIIREIHRRRELGERITRGTLSKATGFGQTLCAEAMLADSIDNRVRRELGERIIRAEAMANRRGVMSRADFRRLKACLHPDHCSFQYATEMLQLISSLEAILVKPEEPIFPGKPLPKTLEELEKRFRA